MAVRDQRYGQYCALARSLEVTGDRWTLLVVRELTLGPRRFTDLIDGLPGISRNLLTERLRRLERDGIVVRKDLPPPAARQVYELADDGRDLAIAMGPLANWGARRLGQRKRTEVFSPRWPAVAMASLADRDAAKGLHETYQFAVDDVAFYFKVDDGSIEVHDGQAVEPTVVLTMDEDTWAELAAGRIKYTDAVATGALRVEGDRQAEARFREIFSRRSMIARAEAPAAVLGPM
jgi:DNA-binding HxlR family transcriptional regulator/putative sterol carrier protein